MTKESAKEMLALMRHCLDATSRSGYETPEALITNTWCRLLGSLEAETNGLFEDLMPRPAFERAQELRAQAQRTTEGPAE